MITIPNIGVTVTDNYPPYRFVFESDSPCITFDNPDGTTTNKSITTNLLATSSACIVGANVTVTVINSKGCVQTADITVDDPCLFLTCSNAISQPQPLRFTMWASSVLCNSVTFDWTWDDEYELVSQTDSDYMSTVQLKLKSGLGATPTSSDISVNITDCNGCEITRSLTYDVCRPVVYDTTAKMFCTDPDASTFGGQVQIPTPGGDCTSAIDWDGLAITIINEDGVEDSSLNVTKGEEGFLTLSGINLIENPTIPYQLKYTVRNEVGVRSYSGTINIIVYACDSDKHIYGIDFTYEVPDGTLAGAVLDIPIKDYIIVGDGYEIDASSFSLVTPPNPISATITFQLEGYNSEPVIQYTVPVSFQVDVVGFTLCDTEGFCSDTIYMTVYEENGSPDAADALSDDTIPLAPIVFRPSLTGANKPSYTTTTITSQPTKGTVQVLSTGEVKYTPNAGTQGADSFDYTIQDTTGTTATDATASITIVYAGEDTTYNICAVSTETPYDILDANSPTSPTTGGTWTLLGGTGPAAPGVYNGTIDFTGWLAREDAFCYEYSVTSGGSTDTSLLTFFVDPYEAVNNETCGTANVITLGVTSGSTAIRNNIQTAQVCPGSVGATDSGIAEPASWNIAVSSVDVWYRMTVPTPTASSYTFVVEANSSAYSDAEAMKYPKLALYTDCIPTLVADTGAASERTSYLVYTEASSPSPLTTFYIRVAAEDGEQGKFDLRLEII